MFRYNGLHIGTEVGIILYQLWRIQAATIPSGTLVKDSNDEGRLLHFLFLFEKYENSFCSTSLADIF